MTLEELQEQMLQLKEQQKIVIEENEALKTQIEDKNKREKELEELNQRMFLRLTTPVEHSKDNEVNENDEIIKDFIGEKVFNVLSEKEKNVVSEILEGED